MPSLQAEKKIRWEKAKREREAEAAKEEAKTKAAKEAAADDDDPLAGFLDEIKDQVHAPIGLQVSCPSHCTIMWYSSRGV